MIGDLINIKMFNELPQPVTAILVGGDKYWIESLCVQTGLMRIDVCGQIDILDFCDATILIDANGDRHDPDKFYMDCES